MSGWRDGEGRTASDRRKHEGRTERLRFMETLRYRPQTLIKPALSAAFVALLIFALINAFI